MPLLNCEARARDAGEGTAPLLRRLFCRDESERSLVPASRFAGVD